MFLLFFIYYFGASLLIAGKKALFTKEELDNNSLYDHGYASNSKAVVLLREILVELIKINKKILEFVTVHQITL